MADGPVFYMASLPANAFHTLHCWRRRDWRFGYFSSILYACGTYFEPTLSACGHLLPWSDGIPWHYAEMSSGKWEMWPITPGIDGWPAGELVNIRSSWAKSPLYNLITADPRVLSEGVDILDVGVGAVGVRGERIKWENEWENGGGNSRVGQVRRCHGRSPPPPPPSLVLLPTPFTPPPHAHFEELHSHPLLYPWPVSRPMVMRHNMGKCVCVSVWGERKKLMLMFPPSRQLLPRYDLKI